MAKKHQRKTIVFVSLIGVLTFTSALLLALAPDPLTPGTQTTLFNASPNVAVGMEAIFQTDRPVVQGRWTGILIRHSETSQGNALSVSSPNGGVGDHFVIGNGRGSVNGEIEISARWMAQSEALSPAGLPAIDPACISICLIGDFGDSKPTELQVSRLQALVSMLQQQLGIPSDRVWSLSPSRAQ